MASFLQVIAFSAGGTSPLRMAISSDSRSAEAVWHSPLRPQARTSTRDAARNLAMWIDCRVVGMDALLMGNSK